MLARVLRGSQHGGKFRPQPLLEMLRRELPLIALPRLSRPRLPLGTAGQQAAGRPGNVVGAVQVRGETRLWWIDDCSPGIDRAHQTRPTVAHGFEIDQAESFSAAR